MGRPPVTDEIASIRPYQAGTPIERVARELGLDPREIVKLASNENPLGPSPLGVAAAHAAIASANRYPDSAAPELCGALARHFRVETDRIVVGNGSNELLELVVRTFCTRNDHVVFADPSFVVYPLACLAQGVPFTAVPLKGWTHDLEAMRRAVRPETRVVFVANPNNPTGTHVGEAELRDLLRALPSSVLVVLDEAYAEYADASDYPSGAELGREYENVIAVRTFSKAYGLASFRVGYAVMSSELCGYVHRVRAPFNVGGVAQAAAAAALGDVEHLQRSVQLNAEEKVFLTTRLRDLGLDVVPSQANFLLVDVHRSGADVYDALLRRGVIVRAIPPLPTCVRISLGTRAENLRCAEALEAVLAQ